jgi:hypothetical protein
VIGIVVTTSSIGGGGDQGSLRRATVSGCLSPPCRTELPRNPCKPLKRNGNGCNNVRQGFDSQQFKKCLILLVPGARLGQPPETAAAVHSAPWGFIGRVVGILQQRPNPVLHGGGSRHPMKCAGRGTRGPKTDRSSGKREAPPAARW